MKDERVLGILLQALHILMEQQEQINDNSALQASMLLVLNEKVVGFDQELKRVHCNAEALLNVTEKPILRKLKALAQELEKEI